MLWLQPRLYFAGLYCYWDQIDGLQQGSGLSVAVREVGYVAATFLCLYANPAYLLVDVWASVRDQADGGANSGVGFLLTYTLAPEKFVFMAALGKGGLSVAGFKALAGLHLTDIYQDGGIGSFVGVTLLLLLDLCGVCALVVGLASPAGLPHALGVGYCATALGSVCLLLLTCCAKPGATANSMAADYRLHNHRL